MANRVLLNNVDHHALRMVQRYGPEHGNSVNQSLIVPAEFEEVQRDYPIFFRADGEGGLQAVALLGLASGENLFLEGQVWNARYIPAVQRRGPFFISVSEDGESSIYVDLDDSRIGETQGESLFRQHGGNGPLLEMVTGALKLAHAGLAEARAMFAAFADLDLIVPVKINVDLGDGLTVKVPDLLTIAADRFDALSGAGLRQLHEAGYLAAAIHAQSSLGNVARLIELKNRQRMAG